MNIAIRSLLEVQETSLLVALAARRLFRRPVYLTEMFTQADVGGGAVSTGLYGMPMASFFSSVRHGITTDDITGGVIKPIVFALIIGSVACHKGLSTEGGTVGVGRSTTSAVVTASILVIVADFFLAKALQVILNMPGK